MTNIDSFQQHDRFVKRMVTGVVVAIGGIFCGYAISAVSLTPSFAGPQTTNLIAVNTSVQTTTLNRAERIAMRRARSTLPDTSIDAIGTR